MKVTISLYEFYAMGVNTLLTKAPWENGSSVSPYRESFLDEQRTIALSILFLMGEDYVPESVLNTMPHMRDQVRNSVNQAVFLRALKHHFRHVARGDELATKVLLRMESYITITRDAKQHNADPLEALTYTLAKRVPAHSDEQFEKYKQSVGKIFRFTEALVKRSLQEKYTIAT